MVPFLKSLSCKPGPHHPHKKEGSGRQRKDSLAESVSSRFHENKVQSNSRRHPSSALASTCTYTYTQREWGGEMEGDRQTDSRIKKDRTSIKSHEVIHLLSSLTDNKKKPRVKSKARAEGHAANLQYKSAAAAKPP